MSLFSIGMSGLNVASTNLAITNGNVANLHTPGHTRKHAVLEQQSVGGGVAIAAKDRLYDKYAGAQLRGASSALASLDTQSEALKQIDDLFAASDSGLLPMMSQFKDAIGDFAGAPFDAAARNSVLGTARSLTANFRALDGQLADMEKATNAKIEDETRTINMTAGQIAQLNKQFSIARAGGHGDVTALADQRDAAVSALAKLVDVKLIEDERGTYNVSIGQGLALVTGAAVTTYATVPSSTNPEWRSLAMIDAAGNTVEIADRAVTGGTLGGAFTTRSEALGPTRRQLGAFAASMAAAFNAVHEAGIDAKGDAAGALFQIGAPSASKASRNDGTASISAAFDPGSTLDAGEFEIVFQGGGYAVTRLGSKEPVAAVIDPGAGTLAFGGVKVTISGTPADGDRFHVRPTAQAARGFALALSDPQRLAAGLGTAPGDNRNALALVDLFSAPLVEGRATLTEAHASMIADVGILTTTAVATRGAQEVITTTLQARFDQETGVNLDEEAVNLVRFQQYYQANAKVIETAATLLDTILGLRA